MNAKSQISDSKRQINPKPQISGLVMVARSFFGDWDLAFGGFPTAVGKTLN